MIFAREVSDPLTSLVKSLEKATVENSNVKMGSFVVFLSDDKTLADKLKALAKDNHIEHTVLAVHDAAGPEGYTIPKEANVTVVLYVKRTVKANHTFGQGQLTDAAVASVLKDIPKILVTPEEPKTAAKPPSKPETKPH
jgi:hypothetical protein